jgi:selT/selW/selH-like putative selenoprotein
LPQASSLQAAIKDKYGITARLKEGVGGIFEVSIDDRLVYTNADTYRFPENEEIFTEIDAVKAKG